MNPRVKLFAVRDRGEELPRMLAVVEACGTAGVSYPPEVAKYFGDALEQHAGDSEQLRSAMLRTELPMDEDCLASGGVKVWLGSLPDDATSLQISVSKNGSATTPYVGQTETKDVDKSLLSESLRTKEFGPFLDYLDEHGCVHLRARISHMLSAGELDWLNNVYFSSIDTGASLSTLEAKAQQANELLGHKI